MGVGVISIRPFQVSDIPDAVILESESQPAPWTEDLFLDELAAEHRIYFAARDHGLAGFAGVMVEGDEAHVTNLAVDPARRGRGIGRRLMLALMEAAIAQGARHLTLEVRSKNEAALALYESLGLAPVGVLPGYYGDDDALVLWAHDIHRPGFVESIR